MWFGFPFLFSPIMFGAGVGGAQEADITGSFYACSNLVC